MKAINEFIKDRFNIHGKEHVGIDKYGREDLLNLFKDLGFTKGAEIGVHKGKFSLSMMKIIPGLQLLCVDPWYAYDAIDAPREEHYLAAKDNLKDFNATLKKMTSVEAVKDVEDESLDFVYIDADHKFDGVMIDIILWSKKVRKGGIVSGHDFVANKNCHVPYAVEAYTKSHDIKNWYVTNGRGNQSFFWVKQ